MTSSQTYDIFQVISSSSTNYTTPNLTQQTANGRRTSMPTTSTIKQQKEPERKRSVLASDGLGLSQLSFEFHSNFDRNGPDRSALRRRHTVDREVDSNASVLLTRTRPKLVKQINSVQSDDSAFGDDLCDSVELDESANSRTYSNYSRLEELVNQMSIESNVSDASDIVSSQLMKLRSASVDSGYLDTVSSISSTVWNETNDGLTVVDEDDYHEIEEFDEDRLSQSSSNFDVEEEFAVSFNETLNRLLKGRREIFHSDVVYSEAISPRVLRRIFENVNFRFDLHAKLLMC